MTIEIYEPLSFSEIGQRAGNEDTVYPRVGEATPETQLFIVCDGIGGADKGEVASRLLAEGVSRYVTTQQLTVLNDWHLEKAFHMVAESYRNYLNDNALVNRMGSTLALLHLHPLGATLAHLGDSRVFQIRNGKIIYQTKDHRQVIELVEAGIISTEQALTHPWRNRLSRAVVITAAEATHETFVLEQPDIVYLIDIQPDDYFFLCSDGVLEQLSPEMLETVLALPISDFQKLQMILDVCHGFVKDNYSGHLIHIKQI